jgi:protein arginine N-methyltransferase 7
LRIVPILRSAIAAGLVASDAAVVPRASRVFGMLVELRLNKVRGFDLTAMNIYRWHPTAQPLLLEREPHRKLSAPFPVCDVDFMAACADTDAVDTELAVSVTADGVWNAVAVWHELDMGDDSVCDVNAKPTAPVAIYYLDEQAVASGACVALRVRRDDTQLVFRSEPAAWRARHACIPTWHYDMLNDDSRNAAYERAITRAVLESKASGNPVRRP